MHGLALPAIITLLLPLLLGLAWLSLLPGPRRPGFRMILFGYAMLLGLIATTLIIQLLDGLDFTLNRFNIVAALSLSILIGAALTFTSRRARTDMPSNPDSPPMSCRQALTSTQRLLLCLLGVLILYRFSLLTAEICLRPLFPWDASMHWATKAKVWFAERQIAPFVTPKRWIALEGAGVFTDRHPDYPEAVSLLQLWVSVVLGHWNESLVNIPWLACFVALGAMFYGQARWAGASIIFASAFTYMLLSMPLLNVHVALGGYADLFLGSCYAAAVMAFYNWSVGGDRAQGLLTTLSALACCLIKNEGLFWLLSFIPGVLLALLPLRKAAWAITALVISAVCVILLVPADQVVAGHSLAGLALSFHPEALTAVAASFFSKGSWHLLAYLLPLTVFLWLLVARQHCRQYLPLLAVLGTALLLFLLLFTCTNFYKTTFRFTAVSRISLQLAPANMFLLMLLVRELWQSDTAKLAGAAVTPED